MLTFSRFSLDPSGRALLRDGVRVDAQPLVLALLAHLVKNRDRLVTKEELIRSVWQDQDVNDETIARAVMKARRAIDDDARAPVHILTEPGRGYRFTSAEVPGQAALAGQPAAPTAAKPPEAPAPARPVASRGTGTALGEVWRVLPFVNRSENPALNWTVTGLQRLLHHAMETASQVTAVTSDIDDGSQSGMPASRVLRATTQRPADCVVTGDIDEAQAGFQLTFAWKAPGHPVQSLVLDGPELPPLVLRAAGQLVPPAPWQVEVARHHPQAWARLNESIAHLQRWPRDEIATRLKRCYDALPALPQLLLQQAELMSQLEEPEHSEAAALQALQRLDDDAAFQDDIEHRLAALVILNACALQRGDLSLTTERVAQSQDFVGRHEGRLRPGRHLIKMWGQAAFLQREAGDFVASAAHRERAILVSIRAGLQDLEIWHRAQLAQVLSWLGEPHRAEDSLRQVASRAAAAGDRHALITAKYTLGYILLNQGRTAESVRWAQKSLAVGLGASTDRNTRASRILLAEALTAAGQLGVAERFMQWRRRYKPASSAHHEISMLNTTGWIWWRQGRLEDAAECYAEILQHPVAGQWVKWANYLRSEYATLLALLGRTREATAVLDALASVTLPAVVGRARAAIAMAEGRRSEALTTLQALLPHLKPGEPGAHLPLIDLAWLLLEDGDDEAEFMVDRSIAMESDGVGVQWIRLALQDRLSGDVPPETWAALRAASPSLVRHCPRVGTPEDVQARRAVEAVHLPNLLTVLAW